MASKEKPEADDISPRPIVKVTVEGDAEVAKEVKGILSVVLEWHMTEDLTKYERYLQKPKPDTLAFFLIQKQRRLKT